MNFNPDEKQSYIDEFAASIEHGQRLVQGKGQFTRPIVMKAEGVSAHLLLLSDRLRIQKKEEKTFLNQGFKPNRDIPLAQISGIRLKKATTLGNGYIQILVNGADETRMTDARRDDNTVLFRGAHEVDFEKIKMAIEMKLAAAEIDTAGIRIMNPTPSQPQPREMSYIEELEKLAALRDKGVLTEDEFAAKKRKILGI